MLPPLKTDLPTFEALHEFVDGTRAVEISIPRMWLQNLIEDNTAMYANLAKDDRTEREKARGLETPGGVPEAAHRALTAQKRQNSKNVNIEKKIVLFMLIDHSVLLEKLSH